MTDRELPHVPPPRPPDPRQERLQAAGDEGTAPATACLEDAFEAVHRSYQPASGAVYWQE